ncbi:transporter [Rubripirellula amarantea]|nr:transporter [Rubripirellula amarantea]MDA8743555.1 transporter [Rubripirellula amarantea]
MPIRLAALIVLALNVASQADDHMRSRADKHAPAALMGDHIHDPGEWMVEYKYMNMYMDGNRAGSHRLSDAESVAFGASSDPVTNRGASPTAMTHEMHMLHLMRGITEDITLYTMIMMPSITMDHIRGPMNPAGPGTSFTTHNSGFGDLTIGALLRLYTDVDDDVIFNLGASLPTGDIFRTTSEPTGGAVEQPLPYPMRLGSGTFNARPGITWKHYYQFGSFGTQFQTNLPVGRNYRDYSIGDEFRLNAWYSHLITHNLSTSVRLENLWLTNYDGEDPQSTDALISTNVESFRGGYSLNLGLGIAALVSGHLLNVEFVPTLYQDLDGIQLETDWSIAASWSKSF